MTEISPRGRALVLGLLILAYTLNFLDRQILSILAEPIKAEFGLSDANLGWLGGLAFGLVYSVLALPAAWLADRFSRVWIMTGALAVWSGFTTLCGLAGSYVHLFIARMGVGVGEAGGVAPAYSLISDIFPSHQRARALAIFSFGIPIGAAAGTLFGGLIAKAVDWRFAFVVMGVAGLLVAPVFRLLIKDPPRPATERPASISLWATLSLVAPKPAFWLLSFGAGCSSLVGYGLMFWLPSFLKRSLGLELVDRSVFLAALMFFGGIAGLFAGGWLADRFGARSRAAYAIIPACAFTASIPLYASGVLADSPVLAFVLFIVPQALSLMWFGPVLTAVQHLGPAHSRSQVSALFLLINNLIGLGAGPAFFGEVSDLLKPHVGDESIKYAFLCGLGFYGIAAGLLLMASRRLKTDWVE